jgi:hypothetical protein
VIRAAIDIGMGGPKLHVAEVDPDSGRIVHMLYSQRYFVNFYESLSQKVGVAFRNKMNDPHTTVVGTGSVFGFGISAMVDGKNPFSLEDLATAVESLPGKTDADLGGGDYAFCEGTNAILALGFMRGLHIPKMHILNSNNADGALVDRDFWK